MRATAKYWAHVLTEIKNRGTLDVCIVVCDGLTGLPDAVTVDVARGDRADMRVHYVEDRIMWSDGCRACVGAGQIAVAAHAFSHRAMMAGYFASHRSAISAKRSSAAASVAAV